MTIRRLCAFAGEPGPPFPKQLLAAIDDKQLLWQILRCAPLAQMPKCPRNLFEVRRPKFQRLALYRTLKFQAPKSHARFRMPLRALMMPPGRFPRTFEFQGAC